ncbi:MAG: DUF4293 domain-containing protein, partial [Bacteroidales bacterium]|nr:DUF4293 domain-containing protein [Bacteroidales bacterium]
AVMLLYLFMTGKSLEAKVHFKIFIAFPIISAILLWLAMRAIGKDEALIRSIDRIR